MAKDASREGRWEHVGKQVGDEPSGSSWSRRHCPRRIPGTPALPGPAKTQMCLLELCVVPGSVSKRFPTFLPFEGPGGRKIGRQGEELRTERGMGDI